MLFPFRLGKRIPGDGVLQVLGNIVERFHQLPSIHEYCGTYSVCEQYGHQPAGIMSPFEDGGTLLFVTFALPCLRKLDTEVFHNIFHVVLTGIHDDVKQWVQPLQFLTEIEHTQHTAT